MHSSGSRLNMYVPMTDEEKTFIVVRLRAEQGSSNEMPSNSTMRTFINQGIRRKRLEKSIQLESVRNFLRWFVKTAQRTATQGDID